ncbi:aminoglycoside adenylyltransferase domain-containing protein [Legionella waltersii]|uniref:Aminoglycoside (3'') (9) adenylyltransferase n=1 Tax=Legionella waltersii TaxID=66969 RepID=A0A0W1AP75_9GAMM|nr:aminoglycoside adenylyltransferase domain-containing protein [Legionella waltersii]KTD83070.1 multifunctional nucleotidyltransferase/glutamate rich protein GrpB/ribosomal protein alanine acetyltransferase [Legionella waltersii]SNV08155.1 nucleotidyltransferase PLUS glutamate rich protein GrpB PLUS ribosomal protein alanine acetyltransferase [Legionella waltersii]
MNALNVLHELSNAINKLYGYVTQPGDNFGEPAINSGPCAVFANSFFKLWNQKFSEKVHIVFIMQKDTDECWHTLIRLPNGSLYDGGYGVHSEEKYSNEFTVVNMYEYNRELLEKHAYGLEREYPRYCPSFSVSAIEQLIVTYLEQIPIDSPSNVVIQSIDSEIKALLQELVQKVQANLLDSFIGLYVGGSIANNSFNANTSDIDCYIITTEPLSEITISQIEAMHNELYSSHTPYVKKIEASYIAQNELLNFNPENKRPYFNEGKLYLAPYGNNFIIELSLLRNKGIAISGPDIKGMIKEVSPEELQLAIKKNLAEYWRVMLTDLVKLKRSDYQVFAIFTMCRTLYSLETGGITSKTKAAHWVINKYSVWSDLILKAIACKPGSELNKLKETQQFIKFVLDFVSSVE